MRPTRQPPSRATWKEVSQYSGGPPTGCSNDQRRGETRLATTSRLSSRNLGLNSIYHGDSLVRLSVNSMPGKGNTLMKEGGGCLRQVKAKYQALYSSPIWSGSRDCTSSWGGEEHQMRGTEVPAKPHTGHRVQARRNEEVEVDAPIWWLLEMEGHSSNRRNRNRIRRNLKAQINRLERRTDLPVGRIQAEAGKLRSQLNRYQRPPRPKKESIDRQWRNRERNPGISTEA